MNLRALHTLTEIDRAGSFAAAAGRLGLSLTTVSAQVKALEDELAVALFDRSHRPPAMTPAARVVVRHARAILTEAAAIRALRDEPGVLKGVIRVGFVATASVRLLPGFLIAAAASQPEAQFDVESGVSADLARRVASGGLDAAVVTESPDTPAALRAIELRCERFALSVPVGAPSAIEAAGVATGLARCCETMPFIRFLPSTGIGLLVDRYLAAHAGPVHETVTLDSVEAVMGCVNAGVGFAVLPEPDARRYARTAKVHALDDPPLERMLCLVVRRGDGGTQRGDALGALFGPRP